MAKYGIRTLPTVLYVGPDGRKLGELGPRDAAAVAADFARVAAAR